MRSLKPVKKKLQYYFHLILQIQLTRWNSNQMTASAIFPIESIDKTSQHFSSSILD